ncbi:hypothetical protein [Sphingomonas sp. Leaf25]|uniref:hypothetical protein n=1 Tax=Sphingomonas sp. Leaf25 TaxID=1735692 RepID=UPI0006F9114D|nr:hypothetical protein [Sphingomonas sp. Leaf25]KQM98897.1 hypothetical protein ASE78_06720 [Sphingomonas sp. Leaf25]
MVRVFFRFCTALLTLTASPALAQQGGFDLTGPQLTITVGRGDATLPLTAVPSLKPGDRLVARAELPADQSARYLMVVAFLRGATNPPPKQWFFRAETWKPKRNTLTLSVPEGAEQAIVLMVPDAGGGFDAVRDAVRGRPGIFVRAAQDLYQASLDRARLDTFVGVVGSIGERAPERLAAVAPVLADALRIKLNAECLTRQRALQAACLMQDRSATILQAGRGTSFTETLTGAPVNLAYGVAATREGGAGFYSPYIGLARDLARLFGAFQSAQYQYLPALTTGSGDRMTLQLNAAPSFQNPRSVLVAPLPPIGPAMPPLFRAGATAPVCLTRPDAVLTLDDASLLFATDYAQDLTLRITTTNGQSVDVPMVRDVERGGVRATSGMPAIAGPVTGGVLQGRWGFDRFTGPRLAVQADAAGTWHAEPDASVVVGRESPLTLRGGASACVAGLAIVAGDDTILPVEWKATAPDELRATLPLGKVRPGPLTLRIARYGVADPAALALTGRVEASRLDRFTIHAGDREGVLTGQRLDQVQSLDFAGRRFVAGVLTRGAKGDRLVLQADGAIEAGDKATSAKVRLRDERTAGVDATLAPPRPSLAVIGRDVTVRPVAGTLPLRLPDGIVPVDATLRFSLRVDGGVTGDDTIEIAGAEGRTVSLDFASGGVQRIGSDVVVASIVPQALLGPDAAGPLRVRVRRREAAGDWRPLAQVVRLPAITGVTCGATGGCVLSGRDLFVIAAAGDPSDPQRMTMVPAGFVGSSITLPAQSGRTVALRLHDALDTPVELERPAGS